MKRIILASASPRRADLLRQAGFTFEIAVSNEEEKVSSSDPQRVVEDLSGQKASNVEKYYLTEHKALADDIYDEGYIIIGADTVVACDDRILGKPVDDQDALRMLRLLSGRTHQVYTGVTIIENGAGGRNVHTFSRKTEVEMYPATDQQLLSYIATGDGADKAGSYGIQGRAAVFIKEIRGDYNNVVGLPVASIWQYLSGIGYFDNTMEGR